MAPVSTIVFPLFLAAFYGTLVIANPHHKACTTIVSLVSKASGVFFPGSAEYDLDIKHWANSSTEQSACSVEPGTKKDLSKILKFIGETRTPFAVKGGGHTSNPGFSSTCGVHIALSRFNSIRYDSRTQTVTMGAGMIGDDVYAALEPHNVSVVGPRVTGVGMSGYAMGGGYGWTSQQYGLAADTMVAYDLTLPNGTSTVITHSSHPDLFFALKGGLNNFGIVTQFTFRAYKQGPTWGGYINYPPDKLNVINKAVAKFSANNKDPKASIIPTYESAGGQVLLFYDGSPPAETFADFLSVPSIARDIGMRSLLSLIQSPPGYNLQNGRVAFNTVSLVTFTESLLDLVAEECIRRGSELQNYSEAIIAYVTEPYYKVEQHATPSAYPHDYEKVIVTAYFSWTDPTKDDVFIRNIKETISAVYDAAVAEGQDIDIKCGKQSKYPNYAMRDTPLEQMYGSNVHRLSLLQSHVDPTEIMALAGGYRFPHLTERERYE